MAVPQALLSGSSLGAPSLTKNMSDAPNDVAGPAGARSGRFAAQAPLRGVSAGSLIARIGNSPVHIVGERRTFARAPVSGRLYLGVSDDHLADNMGEYRVTISIDRSGY